jgi:hypothetical protein
LLDPGFSFFAFAVAGQEEQGHQTTAKFGQFAGVVETCGDLVVREVGKLGDGFVFHDPNPREIHRG